MGFNSGTLAYAYSFVFFRHFSLIECLTKLFLFTADYLRSAVLNAKTRELKKYYSAKIEFVIKESRISHIYISFCCLFSS